MRRELLLKRDGADTSLVELLPENADAARIFQLVRGQVVERTTDNGKMLELNHLAVWAAIDAYGIPNRTAVFERVLHLFGEAGPESDANRRLVS